MEFYKELSDKLNTQDGRCTRDPLFVVFQKRSIVVSEDHDHDFFEWYNSDTEEVANETTHGRLEALHEGFRDIPNKWNRYAIKEIDAFITACFTEDAAQQFIDCQRYNFNKPYVYATSLYRNTEMVQIREDLMKNDND